MRIGIFGGSFNPVHTDHIALCEYVKNTLQLDKVLLIPNGQPPHKNTCHISFNDRLSMIRVSDFKNLPYVEISLIESDESINHYSLDTLKVLKELYKDDDLFFCMGLDSLNYLDKWHHGFSLIDYASLVVTGRVGFKVSDANPPVLEFLKNHALYKNDPDFSSKIAAKKNYCILLEKEFNSISSSAVRNEFKALYDNHKLSDKSYDVFMADDGYPLCKQYLNSDVIKYILEHHLYSI